MQVDDEMGISSTGNSMPSTLYLVCNGQGPYMRHIAGDAQCGLNGQPLVVLVQLVALWLPLMLALYSHVLLLYLAFGSLVQARQGLQEHRATQPAKHQMPGSSRCTCMSVMHLLAKYHVPRSSSHDHALTRIFLCSLFAAAVHLFQARQDAPRLKTHKGRSVAPWPNNGGPLGTVGHQGLVPARVQGLYRTKK
jgi:hypothetical protein